MTELLLVFFIALNLFGVAYVLWTPRRIFEYPAFMTLAFAAFILPQAISLVRFPINVSETAVAQVLMVSILCFGCCWLGYLGRPNTWLLRFASQSVDLQRLFHVGILFVAIGYLFRFALGRIEIQTAANGNMTGTGTILLFFMQLIYPGFAICLFCAVKSRRMIHVLAAIAGAVPLLEAVLIGRREPTALLVLIIMMAFYFQRRWIPPRGFFIAGLVAAAVLIPAAGLYRSLVRESGAKAAMEIDYLGNFKSLLGQESPILELRNAAAIINVTQQSNSYEYGAAYWNHLVFRYVPAQLLGREFKDALMIGKISDVQSNFLSTGYEISNGSTVTGMGDTFQQFGWFGCLFFALMGIMVKTIWYSAHRPNAIFAQLLYVLSSTSAMRAVTHWTLDFLPGLLYNVIFLGIAMLYAGDFTRSQKRIRKRKPFRKRTWSHNQFPETQPAFSREVRDRI